MSCPSQCFAGSHSSWPQIAVRLRSLRLTGGRAQQPQSCQKNASSVSIRSGLSSENNVPRASLCFLSSSLPVRADIGATWTRLPSLNWKLKRGTHLQGGNSRRLGGFGSAQVSPLSSETRSRYDTDAWYIPLRLLCAGLGQHTGANVRLRPVPRCQSSARSGAGAGTHWYHYISCNASWLSLHLHDVCWRTPSGSGQARLVARAPCTPLLQLYDPVSRCTDRSGETGGGCTHTSHARRRGRRELRSMDATVLHRVGTW